MRWEETSNHETVAFAADVVDVAFRLSGRWLPVDHACALRAAVVKVLPWLEDEPAAGIHSIHGAASGNGWERPGRGSGQVLSLSRRTRLVLRVPARRADATSGLCERRLDIDGCEVVTGKRRSRPLQPAGTVFARYVVDQEGGDEEHFVERIASALEALSVSARKLLCGRSASNRISAARTHRPQSDDRRSPTRGIARHPVSRDRPRAGSSGAACSCRTGTSARCGGPPGMADTLPHGPQGSARKLRRSPRTN